MMTPEIAIDFKPAHTVVLKIRAPELSVDIGDAKAISLRLQEIMRGAQGVPGSVDSLSVEVGQALQAGAFVNVYDDNGFKVRPSSSSLVGREANGYVLAAYVAGQDAVVYLSGINTALVGLSPGTKYLGPNGTVMSVPPAGIGVIQIIGTALAADRLHFRPSFPVVLHGTPS
jgi:hypothetical protein